MIAYVGQTRSKKLIARLNDDGLGEMTQPQEYPPRRHPWALDNGAFADWRNGRTFRHGGFLNAVEAATRHQPPPDFVVVPDVVAGGQESLDLSLAWANVLEPYGLPLALVVQDGLLPSHVEPHLHRFSVLFVGGTLPWKLRTGEGWVGLARRFGLRSHIGRVGTGRRVRWAVRIGADSIDSCLPLWSTDKLEVFSLSLDHPQAELMLDVGDE